MRILIRATSLLLVISVIASLLSFSVFAAGYSITVDGVSFDCEKNNSGTGWTYAADTQTLTLDGYNGGSIISNGNLNVNIKGVTTINGTASNTYNSLSCGIFVNGNLAIVAENDSRVVINGANSTNSRGGDGIVATSLAVYSAASSSLAVNGGNGDGYIGGFAIKASNASFETKNLIAKGGNDSSALYLAENFRINSKSNATFVSGGEKISAITYLSTADYTLDGDIRAVFSNDGSTICFSTLNAFDYGDINCDGYVNSKDAVILAQYLADWHLDLNEASIAAADVYYDGKVNATDAVLLAQYLASWSGITLGK